jgi:hypothetical protein
MAKKSITPTLRVNQDDFLKFKELKEKNNISWTKFIAYASALVEKDMKEEK